MSAAEFAVLQEKASGLLALASEQLAPNGKRLEMIYFGDRRCWDSLVIVPKKDFPGKSVATAWVAAGRAIVRLDKELLAFGCADFGCSQNLRPRHHCAGESQDGYFSVEGLFTVCCWRRANG